jgi:hypothetical protein
LALLYDVPTKRLNEQVKRDASRFPSDFLFRLTLAEAEECRRSRSQIATLKRGHNIKYLPCAFTEHRAIMAANVLNSPQAVQMSVFVVRALVKMRGEITANAAIHATRLLISCNCAGYSFPGYGRSIHDALRLASPRARSCALLLADPHKTTRKAGWLGRERREDRGGHEL